VFRRLWVSACAAALAVLPLSASGAQTGDSGAPESSLGGFSLLARANPFQVTYDSPGLLPVDPIVQVSVPEAYTTLDTGPSGYSLASLTFPGPLLADLGSAVAQEGPECQPPFAIPSYPLRSEAFFPQGPTDSDTSPLPGSRMHAIADGLTTKSYSAWDDVGFPFVFSVGSATGTSTTSGKGDAAVTTAKSVVHGFSMLGGVIAIDSIVTYIKATSSGDAMKTEGGTTVTGATVAGTPVSFDDNGQLTGLGKTLSDALAQSGISIRLLDHHETKDNGLAERVADGLVIEINYNGQTAPIVSTLLAAVPSSQLPADNATACAPSSPQGIFNLFKDTHIESFALGAATVSSNAAAAFVLPSLDVTAELPGAADVSGASLDAGGDLGSGSGAALGASGATTPAGAATFANAGAATEDGYAGGRAIPAAALLLAFAMFFVAGRFSQRFADGALAASGGADCPLDGND
jgi:hypothetical protein